MTRTADGGVRPSRKLAGRAALVAAAAVAASLVLRLTLRDRVPGLCVLYFATPLVLDAAVAAAAAVVAWRFERRWTACSAALLALTSAALYATSSFVSNATPEPGALRGVFWNVEHGRRGWDGITAELARLDPDVAFLAESDEHGTDVDALLRRCLPERTLVRSPRGLAVLVRGDATLLRFESLENAGRVAKFRVVVAGREVTTVFADLGASPRSRKRPVARVLNIAEQHVGAPLLVVGDFNTPRDSATFDAWRGPLTHAFEAAGSGLDATWPTPCPVLAIDHVWAGGGAKIRTAELPWTIASDHLPVVFTFDVE